MSSILVLDRSDLIREGFMNIIAQNKGWSLLESSSNFETFEDKLEGLKVDLVISELSPNLQISDFEKMKSTGQVQNILLTTWNQNLSDLQYIYNSEITGLLLKSACSSEIKEAIECCLKGIRYFSKEILQQLLARNSTDKDLSEREKEVLRLVAKGKSTKEIANILHLSIHTINSHRKNIIRKLNINSPVEFVNYALDLNLI